MNRSVLGWALWLNLAAVLLAFTMIWMPEFAAHWASPWLVPASDVEKGREIPPDDLLQRVGRQSLGLPLVLDTVSTNPNAAIIELAERYLRGRVVFPKQPRIDLSIPFEASNLTAGPPTHQLYVASLATADLWLKAYRLTNDERYFDAARDEITAFARTDRRRLLPLGMLWNDHALAATMPVLADYWGLLRAHRDFDPEHGREVLSLVKRTATRLAKPQNYTFRTNHGLMQNLALLQFAAAFPYLESNNGALRRLACKRIAEQSAYYLSPEGPVLEHSVGYHVLGVYLYSILNELGPRHGCTMPDSFSTTFDRARSFASLLRRPDGSLPSIGNTDLAERVPESLVTSSRRVEPTSVYPVSGFAVRWHQFDEGSALASSAQTVVTWSNYPSGAHKLADDMSLVVWARGRDWLINTGYWPYGAAASTAARGWRGSNAPHWEQEPSASHRTASLKSYGENDRLWWIELERSATDGERPALRRQVAMIDGLWWVVVDAPVGMDRDPHAAVWTLAPGLLVQQQGPGDFRISDHEDRAARLTILDAESKPITRLLKGERNPFGGWAVIAGIPTPTWAVAVQAHGTRFTVFSLDGGGKGRKDVPRLRPGSKLHDWGLEFPREGAEALEVRWDGQRLSARFGEHNTAGLEPVPALEAEIAAQRAMIIAAYRAAEEKHDRIPNLISYRFSLSSTLLVLFAAQETVVALLRRASIRWVPALRLLASIAWLAIGLFASLVYLTR